MMQMHGIHSLQKQSSRGQIHSLFLDFDFVFKQRFTASLWSLTMRRHTLNWWSPSESIDSAIASYRLLRIDRTSTFWSQGLLIKWFVTRVWSFHTHFCLLYWDQIDYSLEPALIKCGPSEWTEVEHCRSAGGYWFHVDAALHPPHSLKLISSMGGATFSGFNLNIFINYFQISHALNIE